MNRALMLAGVGVAVFGIAAVLLVLLLPGPHVPKDYFIIGCMATLIAMVVVFLLVITTWIKAPNPFSRTSQKKQGTKMFDI